MECATCRDEIKDGDTRYEEVTSVEGAGETYERYCSVGCLNEEVGFTEAEVEALITKSRGLGTTTVQEKWTVSTLSNLNPPKIQTKVVDGEYSISFYHTDRNFAIEIFHDPSEKLFEVVLYEFAKMNDDGFREGLTDLDKTFTGSMQRAVAYVERYMDQVESREV